MTLFQHLSYICIYELSVLVALQATSLTHKDSGLIYQLYQASQNANYIHKPQQTRLTQQPSSLIRQDAKFLHHETKSFLRQDSSLTYQDVSLTHQDGRQSTRLIHQLNQKAGVVHQSDMVSSLTHQTYQDARFSFTSIMDSITLPSLPSLPAVFTGGATKCQALKSLFGLTYEQMLEKNSTKINEILTIDLITKDGNEKYNFTSTKRLAQVLKEAREIVVLVHGFLESSDGVMVQALATEFLKKSGLEILALDGRKIINLEYFRSTTYARFMGEKLGHVLSDLVKEDIDPSKFTLIGHSLGAHIAGIAGSQVYQLVDKQVGRVIGLDPAGPCFANVSAGNRLDKTDAEYVDVIHSNAGILGINEAVGHKDFYPSGGKSQPGCLLSTCDHSRAWQIFAESINAPDHFPARKCANWTAFKGGLCEKNEVSFMGISSEKGGPGQYYLNVASTSPYGQGPTGSG
ncbi:phospholipase A1-like isoform X2 [Plodia interpunctella]|uniref:phospholipase A1-like isoform X2 n=1 Tax=Plodia interpunctella TaxID=58824 RepID=UPI00236802ED|nr:phospholipase A1-like isoform X2 [Plodia interpunctella]